MFNFTCISDESFLCVLWYFVVYDNLYEYFSKTELTFDIRSNNLVVLGPLLMKQGAKKCARWWIP